MNSMESKLYLTNIKKIKKIISGFRATGDHIPTPAPIPPEIQAGLDQIYAGIKLQQERSALRAKTDPDFAKTQEARAQLDYNGQYYQDQNIN